MPARQHSQPGFLKHVARSIFAACQVEQITKEAVLVLGNQGRKQVRIAPPQTAGQSFGFGFHRKRKEMYRGVHSTLWLVIRRKGRKRPRLEGNNSGDTRVDGSITTHYGEPVCDNRMAKRRRMDGIRRRPICRTLTRCRFQANSPRLSRSLPPSVKLWRSSLRCRSIRLTARRSAINDLLV